MQQTSASSLIAITIVDQSDTGGDSIMIESHSSETLLETLERNQLEVQFHCRDGFCGACRTKLLSGEVEYTTDPLAFINDDEFLPCCTKPKTNLTIQIE